MRVFALACGILLLAACSSTPSNHYLLQTKVNSIPANSSPSIGVGPVEVPAYLRREQLVYSTGGNQIEIDSVQRWAEPLEGGIGRVVSLNLAGLLETNSVQTFPYHSKRLPEFGIKLHIHSLDARPGTASLVAEWLVYRPASGESMERRLTQLTTGLDGQAELAPQLAGAYSELLWQLSEEIAGAVRSQLD